MAASVLSAAHFHDELAAFAYVEARLWPNGPVCPHCGNCDPAAIGRLQGKTTRPGLRKCYACRKPFTVRMRTIFESSHLPLHLWLQIIHLMCASKKGISTHQIQRMLQCSMKTAWFLGHRIRLAMTPTPDGGKIGGPGVTVEADETYLAKSPKTRKDPNLPTGAKPAPGVLSLVERGGNIRSMPLNEKSVRDHLAIHLDDRSRLVTDGSNMYKFQVRNHESVDHSRHEWTRGDVHTNTLEGFFSIFKRGLVGVYQHMSKQHLERYLAEFDFRQNTRERLKINDIQRAGLAVAGARGKRLMYRDSPDA